MTARSARILFAAALTAGALSACTRIRTTQGYIGDPELMASIKPGVDNKSSVERTLGRPSLDAQWSDRRWFYVTRQTKALAFRDPQPVSQQILVIDFDAKGNVSKVSRRGLEVAEDIRPAKPITPTLGKKTSILQAIFGNIGRVGTAPTTPGNPDNTGGPNGS